MTSHCSAVLDRDLRTKGTSSDQFQGAGQSPVDGSEETSSSSETNTWIMGFWRFGNGRVGRRKRDEGPSLFASSSESEDVDEDVDVDVESEADRVDDESESLVTRPRFPEKGDSECEDELETEYLLAGRCSKTPSPKFYIIFHYYMVIACPVSRPEV